MGEAIFNSPLSRHALSDSTYISLREIADRGMIDLRGNASDKKFMAAVKKVLGAELPKLPRTSVSWGEYKSLWLSIDQWLILVPRAKADALHAELTQALVGIHSLAVNVSDMRSVIRLEGARAREVLMKGTSTDLMDSNLGPGFVRRLRFAEIAALLHVIEVDVIDLHVFRSYADYAFAFLTKASRKGSEVRMFPDV